MQNYKIHFIYLPISEFEKVTTFNIGGNDTTKFYLELRVLKTRLVKIFSIRYRYHYVLKIHVFAHILLFTSGRVGTYTIFKNLQLPMLSLIFRLVIV